VHVDAGVGPHCSPAAVVCPSPMSALRITTRSLPVRSGK
jgi:hypothetical protein